MIEYKCTCGCPFFTEIFKIDSKGLRAPTTEDNPRMVQCVKCSAFHRLDEEHYKWQPHPSVL